ncbi:MAG: hypothetical protein HY913_19890 [Desulfomonile tiedjei]|nr:hypothetical protein [Desulfomonile tiedjei]
MSNTKPLTETEVRELIELWGRLQNEHAPIVDLLPIIAEEGFEIRFRDKVWRGLRGFEDHQEVKRQFFDEEHVYESFDVTVLPDRAEARTVMRWEASHREAPAPRSKRLKAVFYHSWVIKRSAASGMPVIVKHFVDSCEFQPGFAPSPEAPPDPHLRETD